MILLDEIEAKKSSRIRETHKRYLKILTPVIADFLAILFNKCLHEGKYPDEMKIAEIVPIHKKGSKEDWLY